MITGVFVSCYSCAGEQSDPSVGQLGRGDVLALSWSKQSQSQNWKRKCIFFDHFQLHSYQHTAGWVLWRGM